MSKYVQIIIRDGNSYIEPKETLAQAIEGELDGLEYEGEIVICFRHVEITDVEYEKLPEFTGH